MVKFKQIYLYKIILIPITLHENTKYVVQACPCNFILSLYQTSYFQFIYHNRFKINESRQEFLVNNHPQVKLHFQEMIVEGGCYSRGSYAYS